MRRISTGSLQGLLTRTRARSCEGQQHSTKGSAQDLHTRKCKRPCLSLIKIFKDLHARSRTRISKDRNKRTCSCVSGSTQEPSTRAAIEAPVTHGICKIFMQGPLREDLTRIPTRSSVKDPCAIMQSIFVILMQGLVGRI